MVNGSTQTEKERTETVLLTLLDIYQTLLDTYQTLLDIYQMLLDTYQKLLDIYQMFNKHLIPNHYLRLEPGHMNDKYTLDRCSR